MNLTTVFKRRLTYYIVPVLIGLGGVAFSQQLDNMALRAFVLFLSVLVPLYTGSSLLVRYYTSPMERFGMALGFLLLVTGASVVFSGVFDRLSEVEYVADSINVLARYIGIISLSVGFVVVFMSIMRKGAGIEELAERFRFLAEHISDGFILSTPDGTVLLVNQKALDIFGKSRQSVIGHNARELALSFGFETIARQLDNRAVGVASEYEINWTVNGEARILLLNGAPVFDKRGNHSLTMATIRDVTEHRQLTSRVEQYARGLQQLVDEQTRKLHRSEEQLRQLLLSMNEGFLTVDMQYRIRFANEQAEKLLNASTESLISREIFEFVDSVGRSRLMNLFSKSIEHKPGHALRQEIELLKGGKPETSVLVGVAYLPSEEEKDNGFSLVLTPIDDLKRMQIQLVARARDLERANEGLRLHDRAKDSFLSNVTHELRTPLTTIQGYIEMLKEDDMGTVSDEQRRALVIMDRNARHLLNHINELIEFSRMQIRGVQIASNLYDASALAREAMTSLVPAAEEKGVSLAVEVPDNAIYTWGDRDKISQVLGILLNNALKFTDKGGKVTVRAAMKTHRTVSFEVADTGIGIDQKYHEKIFAKFFQVDSSKTRQYEGAGIGLSIALNIVQAHNGSISVQSAKGKGTTFTVHFPNSTYLSGVKEEMIPLLGALRILLVDESPERQAAFKTMSPLRHCRLTCTSNAYEVTRWEDPDDFDIIIINDAQADVAGSTSRRILRQQFSLAQLPVLVLTNEDVEKITTDLDADSQVFFFYKPCTAQALADKILYILTGDEVYKKELEDPSALVDPDKLQAVVVDQDAEFLEWMNKALHLQNIEARVATAPERLLELVGQKKTDAVFLDADIPTGQLAALLNSYFISSETRRVPLFLISGMRNTVDAAAKLDGIAGVLHKPFPISDMTARIKKQRDIQQEKSRLKNEAFHKS